MIMLTPAEYLALIKNQIKKSDSESSVDYERQTAPAAVVATPLNAVVPVDADGNVIV